MNETQFQLLSLAGEIDARITEPVYQTLRAIQVGREDIELKRAVDLLDALCQPEDGDPRRELFGNVEFDGHTVIAGVEYTAQTVIIRIEFWPNPEPWVNPEASGATHSVGAYLTLDEYRAMAPDLYAGQLWYWNLREPGVQLEDSDPEAIW